MAQENTLVIQLLPVFPGSIVSKLRLKESFFKLKKLERAHDYADKGNT